MRILFLPGSRQSPAARFRVWQFVEPLREMGHDVHVRVIRPDRQWKPRAARGVTRKLIAFGGSVLRTGNAWWITRDAEQFDVILMNRDLVPNPRIRFLEPWLTARNRRVIFDFDDAIFLGTRRKKLQQILPCFVHISAGNQFLASFARQFHDRVSVWPTVVDTEKYRPASGRKPGPIRVGWTGSRGTFKRCLPLIESVIRQLAAKETFEFIVITERFAWRRWSGVNMRYVPWDPENEVTDLQQLDIGLMPLADQPFERGKCGAKALLYMAAGIPAVVSPVGVNREIVLHGKTGFHCSTGQEWDSAITELIHDATLRRKMGAAGRRRVEEQYSVAHLLPRMIEVFNGLGRS